MIKIEDPKDKVDPKRASRFVYKPGDLQKVTKKKKSAEFPMPDKLMKPNS